MYWWYYVGRQEQLYAAIQDFSEVLVCGQVSKYWSVSWVQSEQIFSDKVVVFALPYHSQLPMIVKIRARLSPNQARHPLYHTSKRRVSRTGIDPDVVIELTDSQRRELVSDLSKIGTAADPQFAKAVEVLNQRLNSIDSVIRFSRKHFLCRFGTISTWGKPAT